MRCLLASLAACLPLLMLTPQASAATPSAVPEVVAESITTTPVVALTFDDGPSPYSGAVLALLQRYHAHATFFVVGEHVPDYPEAVRAEARAGNLIGNHTYTHADLAALSTDGMRQQLEATEEAVTATGVAAPRWFRPPYGVLTPTVTATAAALGLRTALWSVDPRDWARPGVGAIEANVLANVRPGSIVIMHDGGGDRSQTVAALAAILPTLKARGYRFITLDGMFFPHERH